MNGLNGAAMNAPMVGLPTPAGHQAELNYIYGMVEELSRQLAENKRALEEVVSGVGRVRNKAKQLGVGNEEILASAVDEIAAQDKNIDTLLSILSESLEKAKYARDANASLLAQYASAITSMLKQFHDYKSRHVADIAVWHRSYRSQLAEARAENCRLREQIWDMQAHAGVANEKLRVLRKKYDEDEERWQERVELKALRQEVRFWKRMACPEVAEEEDSGVWSDDDDLVDPAEKVRLKRVAEEERARQAASRAVVEAQQLEMAREQQERMQMEEDDDEAEEADGDAFGRFADAELERLEVEGHLGIGGVAMQRKTSSGPVPPPRPGSAASSTGSTGTRTTEQRLD